MWRTMPMSPARWSSRVYLCFFILSWSLISEAAYIDSSCKAVKFDKNGDMGPHDVRNTIDQAVNQAGDMSEEAVSLMDDWRRSKATNTQAKDYETLWFDRTRTILTYTAFYGRASTRSSKLPEDRRWRDLRGNLYSLRSWVKGSKRSNQASAIYCGDDHLEKKKGPTGRTQYWDTVIKEFWPPGKKACRDRPRAEGTHRTISENGKKYILICPTIFASTMQPTLDKESQTRDWSQKKYGDKRDLESWRVNSLSDALLFDLTEYLLGYQVQPICGTVSRFKLPDTDEAMGYDGCRALLRQNWDRDSNPVSANPDSLVLFVRALWMYRNDWSSGIARSENDLIAATVLGDYDHVLNDEEPGPGSKYLTRYPAPKIPGVSKITKDYPFQYRPSISYLEDKLGGWV
ncbi:hypothetical protein NUU61_006944 [Penicillium alfredii]|uniref:Uncharacterized protein n=1 Tax=Penicillium alfredii TaxID=1506179 RepID=A0A9W9F1X5_9EURO|nr:uncharacterized protein NUU61_006944 [Penicillium alfredii]KAJ5092074.1 hypothetical protein NUU61_006944 [Penicillium alfredii]